MNKRIRTVEFVPGWISGWIARNPQTGEEIWPGWLWATRSIARAVVNETDVARVRARTGGEKVEEGRT